MKAEGTLYSREFVALRDSDTVAEAVRRMLADRVSDLPVVDGQGRLVGIFGLSRLFEGLLPKAARLDSATARVDAFLDKLVVGQVQFRPLPPPLVAYLRENAKYRINRAGLTRATELVTAKIKADSAAGGAQGGAAAPAGPIQPAPGGPPVQEQPKKP